MCAGPCIIVITEEKNQLDAAYYFIVLLIGSTCFGLQAIARLVL